MPLGLYVSVPFCRTKCSYCNFASGVFSRAVFERYVDRVCADIEHAPLTAVKMGGCFEPTVDSIYFGGGTPTVLDIPQIERLFVTISQKFDVVPEAEITVECAPGTLTPELLEVLGRCGVNRMSLGVQSYVDEETRSVGRLHNRAKVLDDITRLRVSGIANINIDLIAGLPHQTAESWRFSLQQAIASEVAHVSVYMLEVDEDSRLGLELIAGGTKYHAHFVPDEDLTADLYLAGCETLNAAGVQQYEISNFARDGFRSRHNLKYWTRQPYLGFGVDAHSMLAARPDGGSEAALIDAVRFSTPDSLEAYISGEPQKQTVISKEAALEETFFLGLRLNRGLDVAKVWAEFGADAMTNFSPVIADLVQLGLIERRENRLRLTDRGRLLSNEVFERFILTGAPVLERS